ncbi:unnamed protein product [Phytomonas sp. Hart1]|nr:unnamed protein product [Phytomonas sp. Hart1]|eukprot:CCW70307.1 unnamed protein product [Phytomonas sp. isolate Hart1]
MNFDRDNSCRCCGTAREESKEVRVIHHERIVDQVRRSAVGSVINSRNRICRWVCPGCEEVNSLQSSICRYCNRERFDIVVGCPQCRAPRQLSNAQVYGSTPEDRKHVLITFGMHNCVARFSPEQRCEGCGSSLHGGHILSHARSLWWCACGVLNIVGSHSCYHCRMPRAISTGGVLERILTGAQWDFQTCTSWFCESCDGINLASRSTVYLKRDNTVDNQSKKSTRLLHGDVKCTHCGAPWHHYLLRDRGCWRCACHLINSTEDKVCRSCNLPAADSINVDVISSWAKGDWICGNCQAHCYRDRARCVCGNPRIKQEGKVES